MNKNDNMMLLAKYFIWYYLNLFIGFCKCNMRNNNMIEIQECGRMWNSIVSIHDIVFLSTWYESLKKYSNTNTK